MDTDEISPAGMAVGFLYSAYGAACIIALIYTQMTDTSPKPVQRTQWDLIADGCEITQEYGAAIRINPSVASCPDGSKWRPVYDSIYFVAETKR